MEPVGITGAAPELTVTTTVVADRVEYTVGERVRYKRPKVLFPRLEWIDATFEFKLRWTSEIFSYFGAPTIGSIVWNGKPSTILSIEEVRMIGCFFVFD